MNKEQLLPYEKDLSNIKDIIEKHLRSGEKEFNLLLQDLAATEGKLLRPILVLLGCGFGEIEEEKRLHLAALIETLHLATLVHDDIIDESPLRRGNPTLQSKYGITPALFMGDFLFSTCYIMLSQYASPKSIERVSKTIRSLCKGEIHQFFSLYSLDVSVKKYLRRIKEKTSSLFSLSLYLGASESNASPEIQKKLVLIGHHIGMAFQIIDDILDLTAAQKDLGKPTSSDLKQGIYSLPIIYELKNNTSSLESLLKSEESEEVLALILESEGLKKTRLLAKRYTDKALLLIESLPDCREKNTLYFLAQNLLLRNY